MPIFIGQGNRKIEALFGTRDVFFCEVEFGVEYCWPISTISGCKTTASV